MVNSSIGILEVRGLTPAMLALDAMEKAAAISLVQAELNDFSGTVIKIDGSVDSVSTALDAGRRVADRCGGEPVVTLLSHPAAAAIDRGILSDQQYSPLLDQNVVLGPPRAAPTDDDKEYAMADRPPSALGFIETQGFTAAFEAIDHACKAAKVEVVAKEKLGGGYITVVLQGDVAAVTAAVEAGRSKVEPLGNLIAAHVIARPSAGVLALLP